MQTKIYLIRHAKSTANDNGIFGGVTDYELSNVGKQQAGELAERLESLHINKIYSSPLKRAIQTISPFAQKIGKKIEVEKDLIEINVGQWENISRNELRMLYPDINKKIDETEYYCGMQGQEQTECVAQRMFDCILKIAKENFGKEVVVVSHIVAIRAFLCKIQNIPFEQTKAKIGNIPNTSITTINFNENKNFEIVKIGDMKP